MCFFLVDFKLVDLNLVSITYRNNGLYSLADLIRACLEYLNVDKAFFLSDRFE